MATLGKITDKLAEPLDAGRVKQRANGRGGFLSYIETHDAIRTANEIFGFGQWGHEITDLRQLPGVTVTKDGKAGVCVGYVCVVKLTIAGFVPTSGVGYGDGTEYRDSGPVTAHELAAKEAESDALKRALKNFGDQFGLALYEKDEERRSDHLTSRESVEGAGAAVDGAGSAQATSPTFTPPATTPVATTPDDQPFTNPTGQARSEPQAKMLHAILPKLVKSGFITDQAFMAAAHTQGASGETVNAVIDSLTKAAASSLITRLKNLETNAGKHEEAVPVPAGYADEGIPF